MKGGTIMLFESLPVWLNAVIVFGTFIAIAVGGILLEGDDYDPSWSGWG